jgi:hypothetical protein
VVYIIHYKKHHVCEVGCLSMPSILLFPRKFTIKILLFLSKKNPLIYLGVHAIVTTYLGIIGGTISPLPSNETPEICGHLESTARSRCRLRDVPIRNAAPLLSLGVIYVPVTPIHISIGLQHEKPMELSRMEVVKS